MVGRMIGVAVEGGIVALAEDTCRMTHIILGALKHGIPVGVAGDSEIVLRALILRRNRHYIVP